MSTVTVNKKNERDQVTWHYQGNLIERGKDYLVLEAYFDRHDMDVHGLLLARGDRFVETYYTNRWYNIFEIHAHDDDHLRGWYCNIGCPVEMDGEQISYVDLALDLLVFPDGRQVVLDQDEFAKLDISPDVRRNAEAALSELRSEFALKLSGESDGKPQLSDI